MLTAPSQKCLVLQQNGSSLLFWGTTRGTTQNHIAIILY